MQIDVKTAARLLKVSEKSIYRWIAQKSIPVYKVGSQYRFNRVELVEWATREKLNVSPELLNDSEVVEVPCLEDALRAGGIHYRVEGQDKVAVLKSVVQLLPLPDEVDRDFLFEVLLQRESVGSTGIGQGVAIPHVRNPIVLHIPKPMVALCFLERPIDYQAIDNKPVTTLFTIISPTTKAHLSLISRLMYVLNNQELRALINPKATREELFATVKKIDTMLASALSAKKKRK